MPVTAISSTSVTLPLGAVWSIEVTSQDADGVNSAVAPVVTVTLPAGSTTTPTVTASGTDGWRALYVTGSAGRYVARVVSAEGAVDFTAYVTTITAATGMPTIVELDAYLGVHSWSDDELQDALDAEASAQRDVCRIPADYPDSLAQALLRRATRNLAMRLLPLAVLRGDAEGGDATVLPGRDPETRRFEAPYRKLTVG